MKSTSWAASARARSKRRGAVITRYVARGRKLWIRIFPAAGHKTPLEGPHGLRKGNVE